MAGESSIEAAQEPTPELCRRYFFERGDVSLGVVPTLLLGEAEADLWSLFWYAARQADDAIERGEVRGEDLIGALESGRTATTAERALQSFLRRAGDAFEDEPVRDGLGRALRALDAEAEFQEPPPLRDYLRVVVEKAGFPVLVLNTLLLQGEPGSVIQRFSYLMATSIQLGDDCRDLFRDQERGVHFISREEWDGVGAASPGAATADQLDRIRLSRERVCKWLALRALDVADRLVSKPGRDLARTEVLLWLYQIESGQLREHQKTLRWPAPLGDLFQSNPPTAPRLAAARFMLRNNPTLFGDPRRWEEKNRRAVLRLLADEVPEHFRQVLAPD